MATRLSEVQAAQVTALTQTYKSKANREAAKIAALVALYYQNRVDVEDTGSIEAWLDLMVPRLIRSSDSGAMSAAAYFQAVRNLEVGRPDYQASPSMGTVDPGVRKSLLTVGPYAYTNKAREIRTLDVGPQQQKALLAEAKQETTAAIASAVIRHAQAGGRQTIFDNAERDETALGWIRVTKTDPCFFCAMLASRGLHYRAFGEGSFDESDLRFTGTGDAKVHDNCGCSLKPVYADNDPLVDKTKEFGEMWSMWGAGGRGETRADLRFRRGYDHFRRTGEYLTWDQVDAA